MSYRRFFFFLLGITSGSSFFFLISTTRHLLKDYGFSDAQTNIVFLITIFYSLKMFIALVIQNLKLPRVGSFFNGYHNDVKNIIFLELLIAIFMALLTYKKYILFNILMVSFFSACRDIFADSYKTFFIKAKIKTFYVYCGFKIGMLLSGALALIISEKLGWNTSLLTISFITLVCAIIKYFIYPTIKDIEGSCDNEKNSKDLKKLQKDISKDLNKKTIISKAKSICYDLFITIKTIPTKAIIFLFLYKMHESSLNGSLDLYWRSVGIKLDKIGYMKTVPLLIGILGSLIIDFILKKRTLQRAINLVLSLEILSIAIIFIINSFYINNTQYTILLSIFIQFIQGFIGGMHTGTTMVYRANIVTKEVMLKQNAAVSSLSSIGRSFWGAFATQISFSFSWNTLFLTLFIGNIIFTYIYNRTLKIHKEY